MANEKSTTCSRSFKPDESFRSFVNVFTAMCLIACIISQVYIYHKFTRMDERIDNLGNIVEKIVVERSSKSHTNQTALDENNVVRERRSVQQRATNMQSLAKRVIVIEKRLQEYNRTSAERWMSRYFVRGRDGRDGRPGPPGRDGKDGKDGKDGRDGRDGSEGPAGPRGLAGPRGDVGKTGSVGPQGLPGPQGEKGKGLSGVKYVRWGRTNCSGNATTVYSGRIGGGHYTHRGGGANYLCLPNTPKYGKYKAGNQGTAWVYGAEYEVSLFNPFEEKLHDHDAPCAVCFVESRGSMLMIPARNDCPSEWTEEYHGYLMTEHYNHQGQKDFICVDKDAEYIPGSKANLNGALLYPVEGHCGTLPCGPYVQGRELTCAVCTK